MDLQLAGKVGIVTGACRGIGYAIAQTLAAEGMKLVVVARSHEQLEALAATLPNECMVVAVDLRTPDVPERVIATTIARFGQIDLLVNNAGATIRGDFLTLTEDDWSDGFALKFFGAVRSCRAAWHYLQTTNGSIVNIVGVGGRTASAEFTIGGSVNAALLNFTKALADRGVQDGVRVNAINPGSIDTERLQTRVQTFASAHDIDVGAAAHELTQMQKVARFGKPSEVASAVAFLASVQAHYCQGPILDIDGGHTRTL